MMRTRVAPAKPGTLLNSAVIAGLLALSAQVYAEEQAGATPGDEKVAEVEVAGMKNPELQRYRAMAGGLDAFDEHRGLAPGATLKAKLSKRAGAWGEKASIEGVTLRLVGNETSIPIPVAADGSFVLPRSQAAYDEDADLVVNQKKSTVRWYPDVRTPGVPANARRLGDLRMECEVLIGVAKKELNFAQRGLVNTFLLTSDWCSSSRVMVATPLGDYAMSAAVVHGGKRKPIATRGYRLQAPIRDKSLPDDALVEFEFWSQASAERKQQFVRQWPIQLKSSVNKFGPGPELKAQPDGRFAAVMPLKPGKWKFRLQSAEGQLDLGVREEDGPAAPGAALPLKWQGVEVTLNVEQAGTYEFSLDLHDPDRPGLRISQDDPAGAKAS